MIIPMLEKLKPHLILAAAFFFLILGQQYIFFLIKGMSLPGFSWYKYIFFYVLLFGFTFIKGPKTRWFFLSVLMIVTFAQMTHYSYYETPVAASEIWLGLQVHEIGGVLAEEKQHVIISILMVLIPNIVGLFVFRKVKTTYQHIGVTLAAIALVFFFPLRTYFTGNEFGKTPSDNEPMGINLFASASFFAGKILPHKLGGGIIPADPNTSIYLKFNAYEKSPWDKVIVVVGESLSTRHMSLYGYDRPTTPFLDTLKNDPHFFSTTGISSGVNTDVSVSFFLNMTFGAPGKLKCTIGDHCIFKLAKANGFGTHFLSAQSQEQLKYIAPYLCFSYMDTYKPLEYVAPHTKNPMAANDRDLLPAFKEVLLKDSKDLVVLHQRGSHGPWSLRSFPDSKIFKANGDDKKSKSFADYDNSVYEFDLFMKGMMELLKSTKKKTLFIYLSDHGEALGENNRWGHGTLIRESFEVPVIIAAVNQSLPKEIKSLPPVLTQYGLGLFVTEQLGLVANQKSSEQVPDYMIYGNDIDGFAGSATLKYLPDGKYQETVIPY
jgi:glucan phosphoethanolaminetransferase (alkaline phosphatase superfamily)